VAPRPDTLPHHPIYPVKFPILIGSPISQDHHSSFNSEFRIQNSELKKPHISAGLFSRGPDSRYIGKPVTQGFSAIGSCLIIRALSP